MAYTDFSLDQLRKTFGLTLAQTTLMGRPTPVPISAWLQETLDRGMPLALVSEKARSEFIIVPILLTSRELSQNRVAIYSGQRLDVDATSGLTGECDFILTATAPLPVMQAPVICIVEAKKNDIESGLGQCAAQMLGAQRLNQQEGTGIETVYGCVTTGEAWQFLRLNQTTLELDTERYYINEVGTILAVLQAIIGQFVTVPVTSV
ncbi:MAG: hypothetical protein ACLFVO_14470 [Chloroflexaceae bacterium]